MRRPIPTTSCSAASCGRAPSARSNCWRRTTLSTPGASACSTSSTASPGTRPQREKGGVRYDAVVFDLLTALIDSWTLWNAVAGSEADGLKWRRRYLEITYGCGAYRPYEMLVREAARDVGLPERLGDELDRRWPELQPWPEAPTVLKQLGLRQAVDRVGVPFAVIETAESIGFYKPRPEVYRTVLQRLGTAPDRTLFVAGS